MLLQPTDDLLNLLLDIELEYELNCEINEVREDWRDVRVAVNSAELLLFDKSVFNVDNEEVASEIADSTAALAALVVVGEAVDGVAVERDAGLLWILIG